MSSPSILVTTKNTATTNVPAIIALCLFSCFTLAVVVLHFLRTDYHPLQRFISEYEVGSYSIVMRIAFFCLSVGSFALVIALYKGIPKPARSYAALVLLLIWSVCVFLAGIFPTDLTGAVETTSGKIHNNASLLGFLSIILASFFLLRFRKNGRWKRFYYSSLLLSFCLVLSFIAMVASIMTEFIFIGMVQRIFVVFVLLWLMVTAGRSLAVQNISA